MSRLDQSLETFYNLFNKLDKACRVYCQDTLYKQLNTSPSLIAYICFKLTKENDEIIIHINYSSYESGSYSSYGVKSLPIFDITAIALEL